MRFPTFECGPMRWVGLLPLVLFAAHADAGQRGVVAAATVSPAAAQTGTPVTISVTGTNPCGAVHVDWGDGTAITYAIVELPSTQKHAYAKAGDYPIVARGMGNCDGTTNARVRIDPAPGSDRRWISALTVLGPAAVGSPVGVRVDGSGTCRFTIDFGDGRPQDVRASLPHTVRHVYSAPGTYTVVANPGAPCEGRQTVKLTVSDAESGPRLLGIRVEPNPSASRSRTRITIEGRGTCPVTVDFGDGRDQVVRAPLPVQISHTYARAGIYEVYAWTEAPCSGEAKASVRVRQTRR